MNQNDRSGQPAAAAPPQPRSSSVAGELTRLTTVCSDHSLCAAATLSTLQLRLYGFTRRAPAPRAHTLGLYLRAQLENRAFLR